MRTPLRRKGPQSPRALVAGNLRTWIRNRKLEPGQVIPSERQLASDLDVHRDTVRRALAILREEGLIAARTNGEYVVLDPDVRDGLLDNALVLIGPPPGVRNIGHVSPGWSDTIAIGAYQATRRRGWPILVQDRKLGVGFARQCVSQRVRGVVLVEPALSEQPIQPLAAALGAARIPLVVFGDEAGFECCDRVAPDHEAGAALLVEWLLARNRRRILQVLPESPLRWVRDRRRGYERALQAAGVAPLPLVEIPPSGIDTSLGDPHMLQRAARHGLGYLADRLQPDQRPEAILAHTDGEAFVVAAACRLLGIEPGRDVLIAGYDNYMLDCLARKSDPYLPPVTVDKRNDLIGQSMVETIEARLAGTLPAEPQVLRIRPELVELKA